MHAGLNISFYERSYHPCLAPRRLVMLTENHCEHAVLMVRRGNRTPCLHTTPPHHYCLLQTNRSEGGGDVGSAGYLPATHQSCLTSPAVPALLFIIRSTLNDSYWATIIPLNVILIYYNSFFSPH